MADTLPSTDVAMYTVPGGVPSTVSSPATPVVEARHVGVEQTHRSSRHLARALSSEHTVGGDTQKIALDDLLIRDEATTKEVRRVLDGGQRRRDPSGSTGLCRRDRSTVQQLGDPVGQLGIGHGTERQGALVRSFRIQSHCAPARCGDLTRR